MHPPIVVCGVDVVIHRGRLWICAENLVVVCRSGCLHRTQSIALDLIREETHADEPARFVDILRHRILFDQGTEHIGDRLVEGTRLTLVGEVGRELRDPVSEFMPDHAERRGETAKDHAVAVAEHHAFAIPESVVVFASVVDGAVEREIGVVDGCPPIHVTEQGVCQTEALVGLVDRDIGDISFPLPSHDDAR